MALARFPNSGQAGARAAGMTRHRWCVPAPRRACARTLAIGVISLAALAGCAVQPEPLTPAQTAVRVETDLARLAAEKPPLDGPLTLHGAMARALLHNPDARAQAMEESLALRQVDLARLGLLPALTGRYGVETRSNAQASSSRSVETGRESLTTSTSTDRSRRTGNLAAVWQMLDFGVSYYGAKQQSDRALIAHERRHKAVHAAVAEVRRAWWLAVAADRALTRLEPLLAQVRAALADSERLAAQQIQVPVQALRYQRALLDAVDALERQRRESRLAKIELARLIGLPPDADYRPAVPPGAETEGSKRWNQSTSTCDCIRRVRLRAVSLRPSVPLQMPGVFLRARPGMNCLISKPCDPSCEELDACDHEPGLGAGDGGLEVFGETAVATEPGKGALHHPTPGQDLEARHVVASLDDLQRPLADLFQRLAEFRSGVGAIGEDVAQPGEGPSDRGEQRRRAVAVLDMGGVNHAGDEPPAGVGEDMALAPLNQLAGVEPARAAAFRGFHRLAVDHTGGRAGLSALGPPRAHEQLVVDPVQRRLGAPSVEVLLDRALRRKVLRQHPPLATRARHVQDRVHHLAQVRRSRASQPFAWRQQRADHAPLRLGKIACIAQPLALIFGSSGLGPHLVPPSLFNHNEGNTSD